MIAVNFVLVITVMASVDAHPYEASSAMKQHSRVKRQIPDGPDGAPDIDDPTDPKYQELAQESFDKYRETHSGGQIIVKDIIVTKATKQIVGGYVYRFSFIVFPIYGDALTCYSKIFVNLENQKEFVTVNCDN
ncbi:uncharacterized protein LOC134673320 [Cydia fagiglandana]|uniref:uncharacterized protein LOC134673320 n=1 Tax=Cydia fagiglandana TaxID=1458189 RepID=UPI002FEE454C